MMYSPIPNPPSKFTCPCFAWTQQQRERVYGLLEANAYNRPIFESKLVAPIERPKQLLCKSCCEYLFARKEVNLTDESFVLGKRLAPDERDLDELLYRAMTVSIGRLDCDSCTGTKKITRKYFIVPKDDRDHHGTLPAPKRRMVDTAANETQKEETKPKTATPRRQSPTRTCAKFESRKRHMKLPRICLNRPRKDCCFNAMDFYHTGRSPQIPTKVYTISSSPADHMRDAPVTSNNTGCQVSSNNTTSIPISPVVPGEEVTMVDTPPASPIRIKLNVRPQTTSSPTTAKSSTSKASQPTWTSITMKDTTDQHTPCPPTAQASMTSAPTPKPISTAEEFRALIPPSGITPSNFMAKAGLVRCGKAKLAEIELLMKTVARREGGKLYPKSLDKTAGHVKTASTAMTGVAMKSPSAPTPSAPAVGLGYSTSSKACQPQRRTSAQAAQHPPASIANTNSNVFVPRKPQPKKQTPTASPNILMKQANPIGQTNPVPPQEQPAIPGLFLLSQAPNGPKPNLFPQPSHTKEPSRQAYAEDAEEDEEL